MMYKTINLVSAITMIILVVLLMNTPALGFNIDDEILNRLNFTHHGQKVRNKDVWQELFMETIFNVELSPGFKNALNDSISRLNREDSILIDVNDSEEGIELSLSGESIIIPDIKVSDLNRTGKIKRSVYVEARIKHNTNARWSCASVTGRFKAREYQSIAYRHRKFRANIYKSNWYDADTVSRWPVWVEFYDEREWDGVNPTLNNIHIEETTTVLIDSRKMYPNEKLFIWKAESETEPVYFDDEPFAWMWPDPNKILKVELEPGYYALATRWAVRDPNEGPLLFEYLSGEFIVEY